jgi:hypothetical protein
VNAIITMSMGVQDTFDITLSDQIEMRGFVKGDVGI